MEILEILKMLGVPVSTGLVLILVSFIKIPKLEINVWQLLGKALSKGLNAEVLSKISDLDKKIDSVESNLNSHIVQSGKSDAVSARNRILRFSDEIITGQEHTKEHYRDMLLTIDAYESYCTDHPDFPNNRCLIAIENIKETYKEKCKDNSFVKIERLVNNYNIDEEE